MIFELRCFPLSKTLFSLFSLKEKYSLIQYWYIVSFHSDSDQWFVFTLSHKGWKRNVKTVGEKWFSLSLENLSIDVFFYCYIFWQKYVLLSLLDSLTKTSDMQELKKLLNEF